MNSTMSTRRRAAHVVYAAGGAALIILVACGLGCDADSPDRLVTNERSAAFVLDPSAVPGGELEVVPDDGLIAMSLDQLPVLEDAGGQPRPFVYEAWLSYYDTLAAATVYVPMGRFRNTPSNDDPYFPRGETEIDYDVDGTFTVLSGGTALGDGTPLGVELAQGISFFLSIEPADDPEPFTPWPSRVLTLHSDSLITDRAEIFPLIVPVNRGFAAEGQFDQLQSSVAINAITGEYTLILRSMPHFGREPAGGPTDPGLIYQVWLVDDDHTPPRVYSVTNAGAIARFDPNLAGDAQIYDALFTGDSDGDLVPEPLDFERMLISIEPDIITGNQEIGSGVDTSARTDPEAPDSIDHVFPAVVYTATLPDVR